MQNPYDKIMEKTLNVLIERFGQPIGKQVATVGVADEGPDGKRTYDDEAEERAWEDPNVVHEEFHHHNPNAVQCTLCGDVITHEDAGEDETGNVVCHACEDDLGGSKVPYNAMLNPMMNLEADDPGRYPIEHVPGAYDCSCEACQEYWAEKQARSYEERMNEPRRKAIGDEEKEQLKWYHDQLYGRKSEGAFQPDDSPPWENEEWAQTSEECPACGSQNTESVNSPSMYAGDDYGVNCKDCDKVYWADPFKGGFAGVGKRNVKEDDLNPELMLMGEDDIEEVTPSGYEKVVRGLKKDPKVDNPWAVAWSMKNKGIKPKGSKEG